MLWPAEENPISVSAFANVIMMPACFGTLGWMSGSSFDVDGSSRRPSELAALSRDWSAVCQPKARSKRGGKYGLDADIVLTSLELAD